MIPVWIKLAYTLMVVVVVLVYWRKYGPGNFLWFSDIAMLVLVPALWLENSLLVSMMTVGVLIPELAWNAAYFFRLLTRRSLPGIGGLTDYMFEAHRPRGLRALSLFHVPLPPLMIWALLEWGYDGRALYAQTVLAVGVLLLSAWLTVRDENVNWVHGVGSAGKTLGMRLWNYRAVQALVLVLGIHVPTHAMLLVLIAPAR